MSDNYLQPFTQKVDKLVSLGKARIAFGLKEPNQKILDSLTKAKQYADIILVGNEAIKDIEGFEKIIGSNPEEKLATMLAQDEIEGIIRGTIDDFQTKEVYEKLTGEKFLFAPAIMEAPNGHQFLLGPASNPEGWDKKERLKIAEGFAEFIKQYGIEPDIAILTGRRHETYPRTKDNRDGVDGILNKSYEDAEWLVEQLTAKGYKTKNWAIDLNPALEAGANILIPPTGMIGNQIFRAMHFCGAKLLTCTRMGYSRPYEDNSRTETDFEFHVKWLVAMINQKKTLNNKTITERIADYAQKSALMKQEGTLSPLLCFGICAHCLFGPKWYEVYQLDYDFFVGAYSGTTGLVAFNWDKYKETTDIEYKKMKAQNSARVLTLETFDKNLAELEKKYPEYHPEKIKTMSNQALKDLVFQGIEDCSILLRDSLFSESLDEDMAKQYYLELGGEEQNFQEFFDHASLLVFDSFKIRREKIILEELAKTKLEPYNLQWHFTDYFTSKQLPEIEKIMADTDLGKITTEIKANEQLIKTNQQTREQYLKNLKPEFQLLADFISQTMYIRDFRKDGFAKCMTLVFNAAWEYFKRLGLEPTDCIYALYPDFTEHLVDQPGYKDIIAKRKRGGAVIALPGYPIKYTWEFGEYQDLRDQILNAVNGSTGAESQADQLKGQTACKGKARGKAKIILGLGEFPKFEAGDILVTSMTRPEFLPLIKKSKAIVTDEGGITCHAAIISRELNIPCIIGTRNATKIFKDNDEIEVDADQGVISKINKAVSFTESENLKLEWQEYIRSGANYHQVIPYIDGITKGIKKIFGRAISHFMAYFEGSTLYWYYVGRELSNLGKVIVSNLLNSDTARADFFAAWNQQATKLGDLIKNNQPEQLKKLSDQQLSDLYSNFFKALTEWCAYCMSIDATDESLMREIPAKIKDTMRSKLGADYSEKEFIRIYNILTQPDNFSYLNAERLMLLQLALDLQNGCLAKDSEEYEQRISGFLDQYWWTNLGWAKSAPKTAADVANSLAEIKQSKMDLNEEIAKIKNYPAIVKIQKNEIEASFEFERDQNLSQLLKLFDQLVAYHDLRKETQMKANYWQYLVMAEIAARKRVDPLYLDWCTLEEIKKVLLTGCLDQERMKNRAANFLYADFKGELNITDGHTAKVKHEEILKPQFEQVNDLQGISVSAGKAAGKAVVALSIEDAKDLKSGEILVTGMTTPEFVPAMKKAAAIVTDEGGITCHAAIISRELGIPCIVGTKLATKLIKTGDLIEVAANHGIVRFLNKYTNLLEKIEKHQPTDWYTEHAPARPINLSGIIRGFTSGLRLKDYEMLLCYYKNGEVDWCTLINDQREIYDLIFQKHRADNKYWYKEFGRYLTVKNKLASTFERLKNKDLSRLSDKELIHDLKSYIDLQWETRKFDSLIDAYLLVADQKLSDLLVDYAQQFEANEFDPKKTLEILTRPEDPLFFNEVELELIELAREIAADDKLKQRFLNQNVSAEDLNDSIIGIKIDDHLDKFCWFKVESFYGKKDYTFDDVVAHLSGLLSADLDQTYKNNTLWQINHQSKQKLLNKYRFNEEILEIVELAPLFAKWQDLRKENSVMATYLNSKYLNELAERRGIDEHDLAHLDYQEIENLLNGQISPEELAKRKNGILFVFQKDQFEIFPKDLAEPIINKITRADSQEITEFPGITACTGKARGKVKIVIKLEDNKKMNQGDILVAGMTRPEQMPAMKKAAAIITNEGGITCHAAIMAREMGIPCVISTKIATQVLKDGDEVEVDANNGIVKIL